MDSNLVNKKYEINNYIQELFDEYVRQLEVYQQYKNETDLKIRNDIDIFRKQESELKIKDSKILELENTISNKNKTINDYEIMIKNFEDKLNEIMIEKEEEDRFNIMKVQAKTIQDKENEIERLEGILKKKNNEDTKIENLIETVENETNNDSEISVIENKDEEQEQYSEEESDDDNYEILTYRKKEYLIKKDDNPISVYEIIGDDELGEKIGTYIKGNNNKMKVILDKK